MFQSINFRSNALFAADPNLREQASRRAWAGFHETRDRILSPTWEDRVVDSTRFGQDARIFWDEETAIGQLRIPGRQEAVTFTRETPFLNQLCSHYQIDKRLIDRLLDTKKKSHREVMEFLISCLMMEPFREVKDGQGRMVRMISENEAHHEAMAFLSNNFLRLDHQPYLNAVETWARDHQLVPMRTWAHGGDVGVSLVQPQDLHPNGKHRGELLAFGITTKNSMTGGASFEVGSYGIVLVCTNGMTGTNFLGRYTRRHVGRRIGASDQSVLVSNAEEASVTEILNRAHSQVDEAMNPEHHAEVQDAVSTTRGMNIEDRLQAFRETRAAFLDNQKAQGRAAQELQHHLGLSMGEAIGVLNRWFEEPAGVDIVDPEDRIPTAWGLVQATTRLGRDIAEDKPVRATELEEIGGSMLKRFRDSRRDFDTVVNSTLRAAVKA